MLDERAETGSVTKSSPYRFCGRGGAAGSKWSSVRPEARPGGVVQEGEDVREKREGASGWKSGGRSAGLADEVGFDAMPDAAGGEAVTGPLNRKG
jgi:hypothetical protein